MDDRLFAFGFPVAFACMWLFVTTLLGAWSGWFELQSRYPKPTERPAIVLHMRSGMMGLGAHLNGILTLSASPEGLGVAVWKVFGLFQRPFVVPWSEIHAQPVTRFFQPMFKLSFGSPEVGRLTIDHRSWGRLVSASAVQIGEAVPKVPERDIVRGMLLQWAVITAGAATFFYFTSRLAPDGPHLPIAICIGFPALVFGFGQLIRYATQRH